MLSRKQAVAISMGLLAFCATPVTAGTLYRNLGTAANWSVLALSGTGSVVLDGSIAGRIGVADPVAQLDILGTAVSGDVYLQTGAVLTQNAGTGAVHVGQNLSAPVQDALKASAIFASMTPTFTVQGNAINGTQTIFAANPVNVLNLTNIHLSNGQSLTVSGSAGHQLVVNLSGTMTLDSASIKLTGGLTSQDVVFNITGAGLGLTAAGQSAVNSLILAPYRSIQASAGTMHGEVIAGGPTLNLNFGRQSLIAYMEPVPEPGTAGLVVAGLGAAALFARRRRS